MKNCLPSQVKIVVVLTALCCSASAQIIISDGALTLLEEGGTFGTNNLATNATAFAQDVIGVEPHAIAKVNDGVYGNSSSWIGGSSLSFIGLSFGVTPQTINRVAFGRDNTGGFGDRATGAYTLQYTTISNPTEGTPDADWTTIGALQYVSAGGPNFSNPHFRHLFSFDSVAATGFRIKTDSGAGATICIDEIELYLVSDPVVTTFLAVPGTTSAILSGTVHPNLLETTAYFEYGLTTNYGSFTATNTLAAANTTLFVTNSISDLALATTYHFRLVAANSSGVSISGDLSFTTGSSSPSVTTLPASAVSTNSAVLIGTVTPNGADTTAYFRYGITTNYGSFTATNSLGASNTGVAVESLITSLDLGTTYHFQLVANNSAGLTFGDDAAFTTLSVPPTVDTLSPNNISTSGALLRGTVNPGGAVTSAYFEYGLDTNYGSFSDTNTLPALASNLIVPIAVAGLSPMTTYHFRLVAANNAGTNAGPDVAFTTMRLPANVIITSLADSGAGTLREAILNSVSGDVITFATNGTVTLTTGELLVTKSITINGPGAAKLSISGSDSNRVFNFAIRTTNQLSGLSIIKGRASDGTFGQSEQVGGGIFNRGVLTMTSCVVSQCRAGNAASGSFASGGDGGGIFNGGVLIMRDCAIVQNYAGNGGDDPSIPGRGGSGGSGGGIYNLDTATLIQCTLSDNYAGSGGSGSEGPGFSGAGGGICNLSSSNITLISCTVSGNVSGDSGNFLPGGGIYGNCTLRNSLVASNSFGLAADIDGAVTSQGYNLIGVLGDSTGITNGLNNDLVHANAGLLSLGNYGGPTPTIALSLGSPAHNAGDDSLLDAPYSLTTDQRGYPRKVNAHVDIGAFELLPYDANYDGVVSTAEITAVLNAALDASLNPVLANYNGGLLDTNVLALILARSNGNGTSDHSNLDLILNQYNNGATDSYALAAVLARLNGNGIVSESDLNLVLANYYAHSPFLELTNTAGLGGTDVTFSLSDSTAGAYTVQYSTNLVDWTSLGLASPQYIFSDPHAPGAPQRFYRLIYP